jgi:hypothetical protein
MSNSELFKIYKSQSETLSSIDILEAHGDGHMDGHTDSSSGDYYQDEHTDDHSDCSNAR